MRVCEKDPHHLIHKPWVTMIGLPGLPFLCVLLALGCLALTSLYVRAIAKPAAPVVVEEDTGTTILEANRSGSLVLYFLRGGADTAPPSIPNPLYSPEMLPYVGELYASATTAAQAQAAAVATSEDTEFEGLVTRLTDAGYDHDWDAENLLWKFTFNWEYAEHIVKEEDVVRFVRTGVSGRTGSTYPVASHNPADWGFSTAHFNGGDGLDETLFAVQWDGSLLCPRRALMPAIGGTTAFNRTIWAYHEAEAEGVATFSTGSPFVVDINAAFACAEPQHGADGPTITRGGIVSGLEHWDVSHATDAAYAFYGRAALVNGEPVELEAVETPDLSGWDLSNIVNASFMFAHSQFAVTALRVWIPAWGADTAAIQTATGMWWGVNLANEDFGNWFPAGSALLTMDSMFRGCTTFTGEGLETWDVSNVVSMANTFRGCATLAAALDLGDWDVSAVTDFQSTFNGCILYTGTGVGDWNTVSATNMNSMFRDCYALGAALNLSGWDVSSVTDMHSMFRNCHVFNGDLTAYDAETEVGWDTGNVEDMSYMFANTRISAIGDAAITAAFNSDISGWDTTSLKNASYMFAGAAETGDWDDDAGTDDTVKFTRTVFNQDISGWDMGNVVNAEGMFQYNASFVGEWTVGADTTSLNSWFNTGESSVTNTSHMFQGCTALDITSLDAWVMQNVTDVSFMFADAVAFDGDVSDWDLRNVTDATSMFHGALAFTGTGLRTWFSADEETVGAYKVTTFASMFQAAAGLTTVNLGTWRVDRVSTFTSMFQDAVNFVGHDTGAVGAAATDGLGQWDLNAATGLNALTLNLDNFLNGAADFATDISEWVTNNVDSAADAFTNSGIADGEANAGFQFTVA